MIEKLKRHQFLFEELVKRDFKKKYKRTVLGMAWSVLSPLMTLLVMRLVFTQFFGRGMEHYTTYLFCGNLIFSCFNESTSQGMTSLMGNANIFTKVNVPKYLFLLSKNVQTLINFALTLAVFFVFCLLDQITFTWKFILLLYPVLCLVLFNIGVGMVLSALFGSNMKDGSIGKISENRFARADLEHILLCVDDDMRMEALRQTNYVKSIVTAQGKMDLERKGKQSYQGWMCARLLAFSNGDLQALFDRSDGFYRRQLVLTAKEKPADRVDDPDLAEKMKAEVEGILLWAFAGLQRLVANNFKFTESQRTRENREAVKRDNNNVFDFLESEGYIRLKADASISSKDCYDIYRMWCEENSLTALKRRSFSDALVAACGKYNLEHCNTITNSAGRRVWGFMGIEAVARPHINEFTDASQCTYVPEDWRD